MRGRFTKDRSGVSDRGVREVNKCTIYQAIEKHVPPHEISRCRSVGATPLSKHTSYTWKVTIKNSVTSKNGAPNKRKKYDNGDAPVAKRIALDASSGSPEDTMGQVRAICPIGLIWDSRNYSCVYDAFFMPFACLWPCGAKIHHCGHTDLPFAVSHCGCGQ
jgi:hypothetical protein